MIGRLAALALGLMLLTSGSLVGCRGDADAGDAGLVIDVAFSPTPPAVGPARLIITLQDTSGVPVEEALVVVEGNMSHAGMTPVLDTAEAEGPGTYGIPDFTFTMAGDWFLTLEATLPDGSQARTVRSTNVVGRMGGGP